MMLHGDGPDHMGTKSRANSVALAPQDGDDDSGAVKRLSIEGKK